MSKRRSGFTLIEVSLFLAITGILFVGIAVGTQNSIFQQRFNDSVQGFAEYLRSAYSDVMNVRNDGDGRSEQAIYGKLITFGENTDLAGKPIDPPGSSIFSYNVIANAEGEGTGDALEILNNLGATVVAKDGESGSYKPAGFADNYKPRWSSAIQIPNENGRGKESFIGALLIVRHPNSGTIYTYVKDDSTIQVNEAVENQTSSINDLLKDNLDSFQLKAVDFCVNPNGIGQSGLRRDVRLVSNARNASGVEIIGDGDDDRCGQVD